MTKYMNKKYIKPSIVVEKALLMPMMETASVMGDINKGNKDDFTVNAKGGNIWFDEEEEELRELLERRTLTCAVASGITMPSISVSIIRRRICFID